MSDADTMPTAQKFPVNFRRPAPPAPPRPSYRNEQEWQRARTGPDWLWVPPHERAELEKRIAVSLEGGESDDIEAAFSEGVTAIRACGDRNRMEVATSRYRTAQDVITAIEGRPCGFVWLTMVRSSA